MQSKHLLQDTKQIRKIAKINDHILPSMVQPQRGQHATGKSMEQLSLSPKEIANDYSSSELTEPRLRSCAGWPRGLRDRSLERVRGRITSFEGTSASLATPMSGARMPDGPGRLSSPTRLSLFVLLTSSLPLLVPSLNNYSAVRAFRALRPLRTISRLPGLRRQAPFEHRPNA